MQQLVPMLHNVYVSNSSTFHYNREGAIPEHKLADIPTAEFFTRAGARIVAQSLNSKFTTIRIDRAHKINLIRHNSMCGIC